MVLTGSKLYVLSPSLNITVFYFSSGDSPKECASFTSSDAGPLHFDHLVINLSGEVLLIKTKSEGLRICSFDVYKMDRKSSKWRKIRSIGNEALFLDQGTTVEAKDGIRKNCIYFSYDEYGRYNNISLRNTCVYDIESALVAQRFQHLADSSTMPFKGARWIFPTFGGKWLRYTAN